MTRLRLTTLRKTSPPPEIAKTAPVPSAPGSPATTPAAPPAPVPPTAPAPEAPPVAKVPALAAPTLAAPPAPAAPVPQVRAPPGPTAPAPPSAPTPAGPPTASVPPAPGPPAAPPAAPAPAAPPTAPEARPVAPVPAAPPAAPAAPAAPPAAGPVAPAARLQRRAFHSRSCCGERGSRRDGTPGGPPDSARSGSAPAGSVLADSAPPGSTRSGSAPPGSEPPDTETPGAAPPVPAGSAPLAAPESTATSTGSTGPTVPRLLATVVTDPSFESIAASALVAELVDFAAACRLDYATSLVAESDSDCPLSVGGECALGTDVLEDKQDGFECLAATLPHLVAMLLALEGGPDAPDILTTRSYADAITGPYSSQWQTAMDPEMASWKSIGTYVDVVPPLGANIVDGMWIFRVKRPPGSPPVFKAHYVARGFTQRDYELHSLDFSSAFLQGSLHEEIWLRRPPGFTGSFPPGTQWSLRRPVYSLRQVPREWHDRLRTTLAALGFDPLIADPSLFLRTDTSLPPFYVLVYVGDLVFATADIEALALVKSELQKRHTCTDLGELRNYLGLQIT
ncbi:unnamed protein product [Closterium sp. NIES-54]